MASVLEKAVRSVVGAGVTAVNARNRDRMKSARPNPSLTGIHAPMTDEMTVTDLSVSGAIPPELDGTYMRIGPNPATTPNAASYHWFTGDGMVHGIRLRDGKALWYRNRWIRSKPVSAALGEAPAPGPRHGINDTVNTNVVNVAGRTFALVEAGAFPVEIDAELATIAHNPFDGSLTGSFTAHPHLDPATGEMHAICYEARDPNSIRHVVIGTDGRVRRDTAIPVKNGPSIHDCALTEHYVVILDLPVTFSMKAMLAGYSFPYRWNPGHTARVGLLPREGSADDIIWCAVDPAYVFHPANAFELADGRVVVDVVAHDRMFADDEAGPHATLSSLERWTVDPITRVTTRTVIDETPQEFPRHDERRTGLPYRYAYTMALPAGRAEQFVAESAIIKHDLESGSREVHDFGVGRFPGEFVFVPRAHSAAEDDGWLIGLVVDMDSETTDLAILDAAAFCSAPVASVTLPHRVPPGFHGNWISAQGPE